MRRLANKIMKPVYRVILLLLLVFLALSLTGCEWNSAGYKFEGGHFGYTFSPDSIMMGVKSKTDTFEKDDVSFELYYGVYDIGDTEEYNLNPKEPYTMTESNGEEVFFAIYVCDWDFRYDAIWNMWFEDYKNVENHYFLKKISEEDAFSEEYGFNMGILRGVTYNHHETISIPSDIFNQEQGKFVVKILTFQGPFADSNQYCITLFDYVELDYEIVDDMVKIKFA